jgi:hypothetical protein
MATTIPGVTPLPAPPQSNDPTNFDGRADPFVQGLKTLSTELGQTVPKMNTAIGEAQAAAQTAADAAATATNAPGTGATSSSNNTLTEGNKTFVLQQSGKAFVAGQVVNAARTSNPAAQRMAAVVVSFNTGTNTLVVAPLAPTIVGGGSTAITDWTISLAPGAYPLQFGRNVLINGNFQVNQDGRSGSVTLAAGEYGHDGWVAGSSGCTYSFTTTGLDTLVNITAGSLCQRVDPVVMEGGSYVLSWAGTAGGRFLGASSYSGTGLVINGLPAATMHTLEFGTGTLGLVQFEKGSVPTPFDRRPLPLELLLAYRYYWRGKTTSFSGYATGPGDLIRCPLTTKATMRASPSLAIRVGPTYVNVLTGLTLESADPHSYTLRITANGSGGCYMAADGEYSLIARL